MVNISDIKLFIIWFGVILIILAYFLSIFTFNFYNIAGTKIYAIGTILVIFGTLYAGIKKSPFIKPNKKKIVIGAILSFILILFLFTNFTNFLTGMGFLSYYRCGTDCPYPSYSLPLEKCSCHTGEPDILASIIIALDPFIIFISFVTSFIIIPYLLSCLLVWIFYNNEKKYKYYFIFVVVTIIVIASAFNYAFVYLSSPICTTASDWRVSSYNKTECLSQESASPKDFKWENETCWTLWTDTSCIESNFSSSFYTWTTNFDNSLDFL